ncbi:MAG: caspase family protein [Planctomycetota bacterium]
MRSSLAWLIVLLVWLTRACPAAEPATVQSRDLVVAPAEEPRLQLETGGHGGTVKALAFAEDSARLYSAGLDKVVLAWNLRVVMRDLEVNTLRERSLRWQVGRGLRGSIFAIAASPRDGLLAIGGYGAMGSLGEILLVDPRANALHKVLEGHRQSVCCLVYAADGQWLASCDTQGQVIVWKSPNWEPQTLRDSDAKTYGLERAGSIAGQPKLRPLAPIASAAIVVPVLSDRDSKGRLQWQLERIDVADPERRRAFAQPHVGMVTALAATADGRRLASADLAGNLYVWDLEGAQNPSRLAPGKIVLSLSFSADGSKLAAGTAVGGSPAQGEFQIWDLSRGAIERRESLPDHVQACACSRDGKWMAWSGGAEHQVFVAATGAEARPIEFRGSGRRVFRVAFAATKPFYRIAFGTRARDRGFNDYGDLEDTFDAEELSYVPRPQIAPAEWLGADWLAGGWSVRTTGDALQLYQGGAAKGRVVLPSTLDEGRPRCYCFVADSEGCPFAIAVGTDRQNSIYVFRLAEQGTCSLLRHFRGHFDSLNSVGVSHDRKYLVSGAADGTICVWSLDALEQGAELWGRWGMAFAARRSADSEAIRARDLTLQEDPVNDAPLRVRRLHAAGPLFRRGIRVDDVLTRVGWIDAAGRSHSATDETEILDALQRVPWGTQVAMEFTRSGGGRQELQLLPAWQPLATLFVDANHEWAYWTPEGYYAASANGHRLFGWQVNRGLHRLPDYYRADQFRKKLERPSVMERLLDHGSLEDSIRNAQFEPGVESHLVLAQQIAWRPKMVIVTPQGDAEIRDQRTTVRATIAMPSDRRLSSARVFANGVPAVDQRIVDSRQENGESEVTMEWDVALTLDERNVLQLMVSSDQADPQASVGITESIADEKIVVRRAAAQLRVPRRLYVMAAGVDRYPNLGPGEQLQCAVHDAKALTETLKRYAKGLYTVAGEWLLVDDEVTPAAWQRRVEQVALQLKGEVSPDDLLVVFFAGHGICDRPTNEYYFLGHRARAEDVLVRRDFAACLSRKDLRPLVDVPCRKLLLLDTCHSGAIGTRARDVTAAVRGVEDLAFFVLTASSGSQRAAEYPGENHGVFTKCLLDAWEGQADKSHDGEITLPETAAYVQQEVPRIVKDLVGTEITQIPTVSPVDLLPFTRLPITRAAASLEVPVRQQP